MCGQFLPRQTRNYHTDKGSVARNSASRDVVVGGPDDDGATSATSWRSAFGDAWWRSGSFNLKFTKPGLARATRSPSTVVRDRPRTRDDPERNCGFRVDRKGGRHGRPHRPRRRCSPTLERPSRGAPMKIRLPALAPLPEQHGLPARLRLASSFDTAAFRLRPAAAPCCRSSACRERHRSRLPRPGRPDRSRPRGRAGVPGARRGRCGRLIAGCAASSNRGDPFRGHPPRRLERPDDVQHGRRRCGFSSATRRALLGRGFAMALDRHRPRGARTADYVRQPEALLDYAYRGVHLATAAAKRVIRQLLRPGDRLLLRQGLLERRSRGDAGGDPLSGTTTTASLAGGAGPSVFQEFVPWMIGGAASCRRSIP